MNYEGWSSQMTMVFDSMNENFKITDHQMRISRKLITGITDRVERSMLYI